MPTIIKYFENKTRNFHIKKYKIILIERYIPKQITSSLLQNVAGSRRIILNHHKLKKELKNKYNFINILPEKYYIFEQFYFFRNAKVIIMQHGSGLWNLLFCKKKIHI